MRMYLRVAISFTVWMSYRYFFHAPAAGGVPVSVDVKEYAPKDIIHLRKRKLGLSQSYFACAIKARLSTVQKWERGVRKPTPYAHRLFLILERRGFR